MNPAALPFSALAIVAAFGVVIFRERLSEWDRKSRDRPTESRTDPRWAFVTATLLILMAIAAPILT